MKRIEFIAPVESMRGKLSGEQELVYADNNNPAYEAPNGVQYARNYQPRFIGAKIARNGLKYFTVKTKSATKLDAQSRLTMGTLAAVAAIRSALMKNHASDYAQIIANLTADVVQGIISGTGKRTIMSLFYEKVADMLQGHKPNVVFSGSTDVTIYNPWALTTGVPQAALEINPVVWVKFADLFIFNSAGVYGCAYFTLNGKTLVAPYITSGGQICEWNALVEGSVSVNPNMTELCAGITQGDHDEILYVGNQVYLGSTAQDISMSIVANAKYTA